MDDLIRRQDAIDALEREKTYCTAFRDGYTPINVFEKYNAGLTDGIKVLKNLPSAQPERKRGLWIPLKTRPMDDEEKRYWEEHYGYTFGEDFDGIMFDCPMPEDGQEVWVCSKCGNVWQDVCEVDEGIGLEGNGDWDDIVAWMPFERPKPWKGEEE